MAECPSENKYNPYGNFPRPEIACSPDARPCPPGDHACFALWEKYAMLPNIKRHSLKVAKVATALAKRAFSLGFDVCPRAVRASALLHDIAKTYSIRYGGSHAQLGATWTIQETHNYEIAQGVLLHVFWPWEVPTGPEICSLPFFIIYADKRVRHDGIVSLEKRFSDLLQRYGQNEDARQNIRLSQKQSETIESALSAQLGWKLHEDTFDSGRLVVRT